MFDYLSGKLIEKSPTRIVVDVHGVGYAVNIPLSSFHILPDVESDIQILAHLQIKEDEWQLYGFLTREERDLFRLMLSVSGIGPKTALTVLSGIGLDDLKRALIGEDIEVLTAISGIGRKTAERMIVELKEKVVLEEKRIPLRGGKGRDAFFADSVSALVSLGYKRQSAQEAVKKVLSEAVKPVSDVEELIKESLKFI
ncbi:MAG: Holliday junction branch migration protein RuvA [Candidatus Omnitrophica bacterium]|nr:Holliday junction branch migration protein RuvA [Candidatus Omnitrophota bacterium]